MAAGVSLLGHQQILVFEVLRLCLYGWGCPPAGCEVQIELPPHGMFQLKSSTVERCRKKRDSYSGMVLD